MINSHISDINKALVRILSSDKQVIVVQGPAGSGKSTLYKSIARTRQVKVLCLASTGIAAENLCDSDMTAVTIHSAFKLKPCTLYKFRRQDYEKNKDLLNRIDFILIDEISMVSCSLMDWLIELISYEKTAIGHSIKMVLFGDVLQLAPVQRLDSETAQEIWDRKYKGNIFFFNAPLFKSAETEVILLEKVYRQSDSTFTNVLAEIRTGTTSEKSLDLINSQTCSREEFGIRHENFFVTVVSTNKEKDTINEAEVLKLQKNGAKHITFDAEIYGDIDKELESRISKRITLFEGELVMCTANSDNYKNGTLGIIEYFNDGLPVIRSFDNRLINITYNEWISHQLILAEDDQEITYEKTGSITQIACTPAYALTIHKVQGLTLDKLYYQIGRWIPASGIYVALSRCRQLCNIGISRHITEKDIYYSTEALSFFDLYPCA